MGTDLATSRDVPALSVVYKLVQVERDGRVEYTTKFSEQKIHFPGRKQVFRFFRDGKFDRDLIARADETFPEATALLMPAMREGRRVDAREDLPALQARAMANLDRLPESYRVLSGAPAYPVAKSPALTQLLEEARERYLGAARPSGAR